MIYRPTGSNRAVLAIQLLIVSILFGLMYWLTSPTPTSAAGICGASNGSNAQIIVVRHRDDTAHPGITFDRVQSTALVADLDPCTGLGSAGTGSYILPANIEDTEDEQIMQIGYGKEYASAPLLFYYVPYGNKVGYEWPGSMRPVRGARYKFEIYKVGTSGNYKARYRITRVSTGETEYRDSAVAWQGYDLVWWGAESLDSGSRLGAQVGSTYPNVNITQMVYSQTGYGNVTRDGIVNAWWGGSGCESGTTQFEERNCVFALGSVAKSNEHGHILDTYLNNDTLEIEDHG